MLDSLSLAKLVIYIILLQPALYCLIKHGHHGVLGWFYVQVFCILRIVTDGLTLHPDQDSKTATILGGVGLSPLLLACAGLLHEVRIARNPAINMKREWFWQIQYHAFVAGSLVLVVLAIVNLEKDHITNTSTWEDLLKAGAAIALASWVFLVFWVIQTWMSAPRADGPAYRNGTKLLNGIAVVLPFNGLRLAYAVTSLLLDIYHPHSSFLKSEAALVCLEVVPEMLTIVILCFAGIVTRNIKHELKQRA